jgi:hypothetical protein
MEGPSDADAQSADDARSGIGSSNVVTALKLIAASALFYSAGTSFAETYHQLANHRAATSAASSIANIDPIDLGMSAPSNHVYANTNSMNSSGSNGSHRRLSGYASSSKKPPSYMNELMDDLKARKKLMEETPPEEVKYWFEYTGPLQVRSTQCIVFVIELLSVCVPYRVKKGEWDCEGCEDTHQIQSIVHPNVRSHPSLEDQTYHQNH